MEQERMIRQLDFGGWEWLVGLVSGWVFSLADAATIDPG